MKKHWMLLIAVALLAAACAGTAVPPPAAEPEGEDRFLIDPRTGYSPAPPPALERRFDAAWRFAAAGSMEEARRRLADIQTRTPDYLPARLAEAALLIREGRLDAARAIVASLRERQPDWLAPRVYEAELALRAKENRRAYELYRDLTTRADAPAFARERLTQLEKMLFDELYTAALTAPDDEAVRLLREALTFNPAAHAARIALVQRLVTGKKWEEARRELDPLLSTGEVDRAEVQEALAEIDVGRGRYQEAIVRYDRLSRRTREPRYAQRLEEIKERWNAANMPQHYLRALESEAITRADFAVLLYWKVASIRFAQNLATPPIAVDIGEVAGRDEMIRAIALGLYQVDPVTRRVDPFRQVTAASLGRTLARLMTLRGAPCARGVPLDKVLSTCGVTDPSPGADAPVTGREAARLLEQVAKVL